jgi:hypothetical protein
MKKKDYVSKKSQPGKKERKKGNTKKKQFWRVGHRTHMPNLNNSGQSDWISTQAA